MGLNKSRLVVIIRFYFFIFFLPCLIYWAGFDDVGNDQFIQMEEEGGIFLLRPTSGVLERMSGFWIRRVLTVDWCCHLTTRPIITRRKEERQSENYKV